MAAAPRRRPDDDRVEHAHARAHGARRAGDAQARPHRGGGARRRPARRARRARRRPRAPAQRRRDAAGAGDRGPGPRPHGGGRRGRRGDARHLRRGRPHPPRHPPTCSTPTTRPSSSTLPTWFRHLFANADRLGAVPSTRRRRRRAPSSTTRANPSCSTATCTTATCSTSASAGGSRSTRRACSARPRSTSATCCATRRTSGRSSPAASSGSSASSWTATGLDPARLADWLVAWCALSSTWFALDDDPRLADSAAAIGELALTLTRSR